MKAEEWLQARVKFLKGLESRSEQQNLLLELYANENKTSQEKKDFDILLKAEKARATADDHEKAADNLIRANKEKIDKARTHELCNSAGLLGLAGLIDKVTGKPLIDKGELLGAFVSLAKVPTEDQRRKEWKRVGDALLEKK